MAAVSGPGVSAAVADACLRDQHTGQLYMVRWRGGNFVFGSLLGADAFSCVPAYCLTSIMDGLVTGREQQAQLRYDHHAKFAPKLCICVSL